jgi:membrane-associated phospholipid phosphatase
MIEPASAARLAHYYILQKFIIPLKLYYIMLSANDIINIFLPVLSHWIIWLGFLAVVIFILLLYAYPYVRKPWKEFSSHHISIPIISVVSLYIFTKMLEGVIYHGSILKVDVWFNQIMIALHFHWITAIASFITNFGGTIIISILVIVTIGLLLYRKRWRYAILSTAAILGAEVLQILIKDLVQRPRPINLLETGFSFPSGHAITAIVFVSLLIYSFKDDFKNLAARYVLIIAFSAFFIAVAMSRIILNVHWFSDVVAGASLGLAWFMIVVLVQRAIPGLVPAVRHETKKAKAIVNKK